MEVYAANAIDKGKRTRRNDHATPMDTYVAEPGPSNSQQQVQVPGAPNVEQDLRLDDKNSYSPTVNCLTKP
ncbi:hypothetical protein G6F57_022230 [Rhizopus arrhizus]|uniref:Uncharacterized protein n=1 Tax=Rhizopus oryzae TaxID=64495 RepID=A0A9P7BK73_RHIOR|nr:hypothetical protein G6F24_015518 [Rhizopus arrhizus]KAG0775657.1 hypothetical protein G6F21_013862 [Rhizopus arrhizus]KAG0803108.1 hypothetical protein G6F20_013818 [Rhizopus arrhizus]KAG0805794.1 hypothetical protein G6F18_014094 [Rhizopus arrhizus]KAG0807214.1 hypothetical protein G6F19_013850 [Rhizopus arrhizus]